jgi:capsular exopolysaccharide synthesis family protein
VIAVSTLGEERQGTARYLQALAQHWPFIFGSVVFAVAAAVLYLAAAEDRYRAHADVLVTPVPADDETFVGLPVIRESGEGRSVLTAARLVEAPQVADAVRARIGGPEDRDALLDAVTVAPQEQSSIVTITGEGDSADRAAAVANGFAQAVIAERTRVFQRELGQVVNRLANRLASLPPGSRDTGEGGAIADRLGALRGLVGSRDPSLQIASLAVAPSEAAWPRPLPSLAVAVLVGLLLGVGIAIALELVNPLVLRDEDVLEQGLPLLARVPRTSTRDLKAHLSRAGLAADVKDAYRLVRVNLRAARDAGDEPSTILVTSSSRGEGKTGAAVNLALVCMHAGLRVVLVDADLRRSRLTRVLSVSPHRDGLRELLLNDAAAEDVLTPTAGHDNRLRLVPASPNSGDAIDVLQSSRIAAVVDELRAHADVVIFDSAPLTEVADALPLATAVDSVVLVVRFGRTRRDRLEAARLRLAQLGIVPAGIVAVTRRRPRGRLERSAPRRSVADEPLSSARSSSADR